MNRSETTLLVMVIAFLSLLIGAILFSQNKSNDQWLRAYEKENNQTCFDIYHGTEKIGIGCTPNEGLE